MAHVSRTQCTVPAQPLRETNILSRPLFKIYSTGVMTGGRPVSCLPSTSPSCGGKCPKGIFNFGFLFHEWFQDVANDMENVI